MPIKSGKLLWLLKKGGYTISLRIAAMVVTLGFVSLLSFWLSPKDYGLVALLISVVALAASFGTFGQQEFLLREVARTLTDGERDKSKQIVNRATYWMLVVSVLVGIPAAIYFGLQQSGPLLIGASIVLTVLTSVSRGWSGAARAYDNFLWALAPVDIFWRAAILATVGVLVFVHVEMNASVVALVAVVALLVIVEVQRRRFGFALFPLPFRLPFRQNEKDARAGLDLSVISFSNFALTAMDTVVVGAFMTPLAVAVYYPANRIALIASFVTVALQLSIGPNIAAAFKSNDMAEIRRLLSQATLLGTGVNIVIAAVLIGGFPFYQVLFPTADQQSWVVLTILVVAQVVQAALGFSNIVLIMTDNERLLRHVNVVSVLVGTAAIILSANAGNIALVALSVALTTVLRKASVALSVFLKLKLSPVPLLKKQA